MNPDTSPDETHAVDRPVAVTQSLTNSVPRWASVADAITFVLAVGAVTIFLSGGFKTHIGIWPLAVINPYRLGVWALLIAIVRHSMVRRQSLTHQVSATVDRLLHSTAVLTAARAAVATRLATFAAGYLAVVMFGYAPGTQPFHDFSSELMNLPLRWDAGWYLQIATGGYEFLRRAPHDFQQNVVFFPAFPMIVRAVALTCGNTKAAYVLGATFASLVCFWIGLAYLYRFGREYLTADQSTAAVWFLAAYPFSYFYGAIYTESLYLAAVIGAFYYFQRADFGRASVWGLILGLTRPNGFLVSIPLLVLALDRRFRVTPKSFLAASTPTLGMACYSLFVWRLTRSPLTWLTGHEAWGRHYQSLTGLVVQRYDFISHVGFTGYAEQQPYDLLNAAGALFVLLATWPVMRRFGLAYGIFILLSILPPLANGGLLSIGRFSSVVFPAFLWLGAALPAHSRVGVIAAFATIEGFCAALFYTWRPLY
jgi:hypothetical protein